MENKYVGIAQKILNIMGKIQPVVKDGWNNFQKYKYVMEGDILELIRPLLIEERLVIIPSVVSIKDLPRERTTRTDPKSGVITEEPTKQLITEVGVDYLIIDLDSGEQITTRWYGYGGDTGDKGIYKAYTGANKYCLMKTFGINTLDDAEKDDDKFPKKKMTKKDEEKMREDMLILIEKICGLEESKILVDAKNNPLEASAARQMVLGTDDLYKSNIKDLEDYKSRLELKKDKGNPNAVK